MHLKQSDLFNGMSPEFIKHVMNISSREEYAPGTVLFHGGDSPENFFILIKGRVQLNFGNSEKQVYVCRHTGEFLGWSGLVGRDSYTASGECLETTYLLKIDLSKFSQLLDSEQDTKCLFYRNLAAALGNRLINIYEFISEK
ncbi:MAG: cyclic nucleotide-binding domain-containing protein [Desulfovermiculus sp.]|nr:cyclic nucleotide-binding domain-containing protein [Desulfovermiculus sp.]